MRSLATILMVAGLASIGAFVPLASAPSEDRGKTMFVDIASEPRPETAGVLVEANDVFINGIAAQSGMTVLSGSAINTGPRGHAVIFFGPRGRVELRSGSVTAVMMAPDGLRAKIPCNRSRITITRGEVIVKSSDLKALKADEDGVVDRPVEIAMSHGGSLVIDCDASAPVSGQSQLAGSGGGAGQVGLVGLIRAALVIAEHMAVGDQRFLQMPPPAADPVTP